MENYLIYEDGNGGQLSLKNGEIESTDSIFMLAYLNMFGGNIESSTQKENIPGALNNDWWGNDKTENSSTWINSETERTLKGLALTGANLAKIRESVKRDNKGLEQYGTVDIFVSYPAINQVKILITITEPTLKNSNSLKVIWDATKSEIIEKIII